MTARTIEIALHSLASPARAELLQRFFKTGPGEYGEGDKFLGLDLPQQRLVAREFRALPLPEPVPHHHQLRKQAGAVL